jgi:hypothetical protein
MNSSSGRESGSRGNISALANKLIALGYVELFQGLDGTALDAIWTEPGASDALTALAVDCDAPTLPRFLAAEILFRKQESYPHEDQKELLALVYATALAENYTGAANTWGFPGFLRGLTGEHLETLGEAAIPHLVSIMDDDKRVYYVGSKEATIGNNSRYRVKDLAAFYISTIRKIPTELNEDPNERDLEIARLKRIVA